MAKKKKTKQKKSKQKKEVSYRSNSPAPSPKARKGRSKGRSTRAIPADRMTVSTSAKAPIDQASTSDLIALRAFLKWQERGGDEVSNWIDAEREIAMEMEAASSGRRKGKRRSKSSPAPKRHRGAKRSA